MTIIKINAIRVPRESGDEPVHRFAARAGAVDDADGFEGYELLKPTDDRDQWLVITRWRDEESFQAWLGSESFARRRRAPETAPGRLAAVAARPGSPLRRGTSRWYHPEAGRKSQRGVVLCRRRWV